MYPSLGRRKKSESQLWRGAGPCCGQRRPRLGSADVCWTWTVNCGRLAGRCCCCRDCNNIMLFFCLLLPLASTTLHLRTRRASLMLTRPDSNLHRLVTTATSPMRRSPRMISSMLRWVYMMLMWTTMLIWTISSLPRLKHTNFV